MFLFFLPFPHTLQFKSRKVLQGIHVCANMFTYVCSRVWLTVNVGDAAFAVSQLFVINSSLTGMGNSLFCLCEARFPYSKQQTVRCGTSCCFLVQTAKDHTVYLLPNPNTHVCNTGTQVNVSGLQLLLCRSGVQVPLCSLSLPFFYETQRWNHLILVTGVVEYFTEILKKSWFQLIFFFLLVPDDSIPDMLGSFLYVDVW